MRRAVFWTLRSLGYSQPGIHLFWAGHTGPSITKALSSPPSSSASEEDGKNLLEKCPRKEKAERFPEGCLHPSRPVCGDFLPKATRGVEPNPASQHGRKCFNPKKPLVGLSDSFWALLPSDAPAVPTFPSALCPHDAWPCPCAWPRR